ncbi:MAG: hypothetical protein ACK5IC_10685 [Moheibacter sp.]
MEGRVLYIEIDNKKFSSLEINDEKFISSTGSRAIMVTYRPEETRYGVKKKQGNQSVIDIVDKSSRYSKYIDNKKYIIFKREIITIGTVVNSDGTIVKTIQGNYEEHNYYKVKTYDIYIPFPDFLGGDITIDKKEEVEFFQKKIIKNNTTKTIKLSDCREDYRNAVNYVSEVTAITANSLAQALSEKIQSPINNIGTAVTVVGGITAFWFSATKNPVAATVGTTATYIGFAAVAVIFLVTGVEPEDMVLEFPQKENQVFGGVYTNDYRNKRSLDETPDWGTKN